MKHTIVRGTVGNVAQKQKIIRQFDMQTWTNAQSILNKTKRTSFDDNFNKISTFIGIVCVSPDLQIIQC